MTEKFVHPEDVTGQSELSAQEVSNKVAWEGGIVAALEYGLCADQIQDEELAELWADAEAAYHQLQPKLEKIAEALPEDDPKIWEWDSEAYL